MMKNMIFMLTILIVGASFTSQAAVSEVTWTNAEKYRDVRPSDETRKKFQARTFKNFEEHFARLSEKLPLGQTLKIDITDVDLAGDVQYGSIHPFRLVKELYFPRLVFSYQLVNADSAIVSSGKVNLKDMMFMSGMNLRYRNESLGYEKKMLDDWFTQTFATEGRD